MADDSFKQQLMLLITERKINSLMNANTVINNSDASRVVIDTQIAANNLEIDLLQAKHDQIENGSKFIFPSRGEIEALERAISDLKTRIDQAVAVERVISAANTVIGTMKTANI